MGQLGATPSSQSEPGSNGNEAVLLILQSPTTGASSSICLLSYLGHSLDGGGGFSSAEMKSAYFKLVGCRVSI